MSLADELAHEETVSIRQCKICRWVDDLDQKDARDYDDWIHAGKDISKLYRACMRLASPIPAAYSSFSRHVRECDRGAE